VPHAAQQEIKRGLTPVTIALLLILRVQIIIQRLAKLSSTLIAQEWISRHGLVKNVADSLVDRYICWQLDILIGQPVHDLKNVVAFNRLPPNQHFKKNKSGGKQIRTLAYFTSCHIFWRHVGWRTGVFLKLTIGIANACRNPEIHDAWSAIFVQQNIRWFQVAMDDALGMCTGDGVKNRTQQSDSLDR
jgi:hypothetical protein